MAGGLEGSSFLIAAAAIAGATALALALPFLRGGQGAASRAEHDVEAYRAQLDELEQDRLRGIITDEEADSARIEISRRLLAADARRAEESGAASAPRRIRSALVALSFLAVPAVAVGTYLAIGKPGYPDFPLASRSDGARQIAERPGQEQAETQLVQEGLAPEPLDLANPDVAQFAALVDRLEKRLEEAPDDETGRLLMARSTARLARYGESWRHYAELLDGMESPDPALFAEMAESMVMATRGYVSPEAESVLDRALAGNPEETQARYYKALALAQRGRLPEALDRWTAMLNEAPEGAAWVPLVYERASQAAAELGREPPAPPSGLPQPPTTAAPGPDAGDIAAAQEMAPQDRMAMIEGMVARLAGRLEEDPDDLDGWLRLIRAYRVLGREAEIEAAAAAAREAFEGNPDALARIDTALP